jgi:regulator of sirC expression with transglutaminase-like and TPR domain
MTGYRAILTPLSLPAKPSTPVRFRSSPSLCIPASAPRRQNAGVSTIPPFTELAGDRDAALDVLALALAAEFRNVDADGAIAELDALGAELLGAAEQTSSTPQAQALACAQVLGVARGFTGDREHYDDPDNSMLDLVLARRRGLPILLSVVYIEVARRAGVKLEGVGLQGHFVVGHFGADPPLLLDPFAGGAGVKAEVSQGPVRPWHSHEIATRMLNNLVAAYQRRGDLDAAIRAASMRLALPAEPSQRAIARAELRALQARLN